MSSILDDMDAFNALVKQGVKDKQTALDAWGAFYCLQASDLSFDAGGFVFVTEKGQKNRELCPYADGEFPHISDIEGWFKEAKAS